MTGELVYVRRQPSDDQTASYRVEDVYGVHFGSITGGLNISLPHDALCGYVWCDGMVEGDLSHSCRHGPPPHRIKIVIPKVCNDPKFWAKLAGREYREPKPLDMSAEATKQRRDRAAHAAQTRARNREARVESLATAVNKKWPVGRLPSGQKIAWCFEVPKAVAQDARHTVPLD